MKLKMVWQWNRVKLMYLDKGNLFQFVSEDVKKYRFLVVCLSKYKEIYKYVEKL